MQQNLTSQAYQLLLKKIINTDFKPGDRISEKQIEEQLGISRTPVREALLRLRQNNLINVVPQSGTYISKIDLKTVLNARFVRISVEQQIMQEAAEIDFSELQIAQLKDIIQQQLLANKDNNFHDFFKYDDLFHEFFYQATDHEIIWDWLKQMNIQFDRFRYLSLNLGTSSWNHLVKEHQIILNAVQRKNKNEVREIVEKHLHLVIEEKNELVEKYPTYFENTDIEFK